MVQWLGLHASTGGVMDSTPVQGTKIMHPICCAGAWQKKKQKTNKQKKTNKKKQTKKTKQSKQTNKKAMWIVG